MKIPEITSIGGADGDSLGGIQCAAATDAEYQVNVLPATRAKIPAAFSLFQPKLKCVGLEQLKSSSKVTS
jgi:hypothetical protein